MKRVSTRRPPKENSFHRRVPTGKTQASGSEPSMALPGGSDIQRRFAAPSVQSGYCGEKARWRGSTSRRVEREGPHRGLEGGEHPAGRHRVVVDNLVLFT